MWSFFSKDPTKDLNYDIVETIPGLEGKSIWTLHKAKKKTTGEIFSVFTFGRKDGSDIQLELAKAAVKRLKTLRHPNILTYVDSLESDRTVYLVTEYVEPLQANPSDAGGGDDGQRQLAIAWGIHQLTRALVFLVNDCGLTHFNVCTPSVFVDRAGEWKLGGVEYMCKASELRELPVRIIPDLQKYDPPEKSDASRQRMAKPWSADAWGLGCLLWEVFNGILNSPSALKSPGKIPKTLVPLYCELVSANPSSRPNPADFLTRCRAERGYLRNDFVDTLLFLEEIQIKEPGEKARFFTKLSQNVDGFPIDVCLHKILPQLISAFEYGGAGSAILAPLFKLGKLLTEEDYQKKIVPCVVKLFSSTDRATRAKLLQQVEHFVDHLQPNVVNSQVFPEVIHGFTDTNATIREVTVKSMMHLAPKLNHNNLNVELLKHFARLQAKDPEGGIRTNTTVCLGKIAHHLHPDTRKKVLVAAFVRAMRDPFSPARTAGILALAATQKFYPLTEVAQRVLPALCQMTTDPEKGVREQTFKAIKGFLGKLEKVSEDPSLAEELESEVNAASSTTATDTALGWAGWAVTSLTSKLYKTTLGKPSKDSAASPQGKPSASTGTGDKPVTPTESKPSTGTETKPLPPSSSSFSVGRRTAREDDEHQSDSDYDEDTSAWSDAAWGEMDSKETVDVKAAQSSGGDGWEDTGWDDADFQPVDDPQLQSIASYDWESKTKRPSAVEPTRSPGWEEAADGWDDSWSLTESRANQPTKPQPESKEDIREQRRLQRKKELEEKRAARQSGAAGPMKLGERRKF